MYAYISLTTTRVVLSVSEVAEYARYVFYIYIYKMVVARNTIYGINYSYYARVILYVYAEASDSGPFHDMEFDVSHVS